MGTMQRYDRSVQPPDSMWSEQPDSRWVASEGEPTILSSMQDDVVGSQASPAQEEQAATPNLRTGRRRSLLQFPQTFDSQDGTQRFQEASVRLGAESGGGVARRPNGVLEGALADSAAVSTGVQGREGSDMLEVAHSVEEVADLAHLSIARQA
eukprot:3984978-Amphidinium_carterae.1